MKKRALKYVETEGGPFILLPMELKKDWGGVGDEDEGTANDYERTERFGTGLGVLEVGKGRALVIGSPEVTAFWSLDDGGVFIQRVMGDDNAEVAAAVERALEDDHWKDTKLTFPITQGKLALFDSAYAYKDADADERLAITIAPGTYRIRTRDVKTRDVELELVRLVQQPQKS